MIFVFFSQRFRASSQDIFLGRHRSFEANLAGPSKGTTLRPAGAMCHPRRPRCTSGIFWTFRTNLYTPAVVFQNPCHLEGFDRGFLGLAKNLVNLNLVNFRSWPNCWPLLLLSSSKKKPWQNGPVEVLLIFPDQNRRKVAERVINQVGAFLEL